jgi:hypothetical protein
MSDELEPIIEKLTAKGLTRDELKPLIEELREQTQIAGEWHRIIFGASAATSAAALIEITGTNELSKPLSIAVALFIISLPLSVTGFGIRYQAIHRGIVKQIDEISPYIILLLGSTVPAYLGILCIALHFSLIVATIFIIATALSLVASHQTHTAMTYYRNKKVGLLFRKYLRTARKHTSEL